MTDRPKLTPEQHLLVAAHIAKLDQVLAEHRATMTDAEYDRVIDFLNEMLDDINNR